MLSLIGKFRNHGPRDNPCEMSGVFAPAELTPPLPPTHPEGESCLPSREMSRALNVAKAPVSSATSTNDSDSPTISETSTAQTTSLWCPSSEGTAPTLSASVGPVPPVLPGVDDYTEAMSGLVGGYDRPDPPTKAVAAFKPMDDLGVQIASMFKEIFYQYTNRSRRTQQSKLGPSQIGTPCDRRLVMHLMGMPHVNPGGDGWAAWLGTQGHIGLEKMMQWADAGQGRFATEMRVKFNSQLCPGGTLDLLDRVLIMVDDHKMMGQWSLDKLRTEGPTPIYRTQLHLYGMGARLRGEQVDHVCLIGWPRDKASLDDLYVWHEPYDPTIARDALARLDALQAWMDKCAADGSSRLDVANWAAVADDCRYCPYHQKDAKDLTHGGCNGRA